jgi:hypothetical protein
MGDARVCPGAALVCYCTVLRGRFAVPPSRPAAPPAVSICVSQVNGENKELAKQLANMQSSITEASRSNSRVSDLEEKAMKLQEELTTAYKDKAFDASERLRLSKALTETQDALLAAQARTATRTHSHTHTRARARTLTKSHTLTRAAHASATQARINELSELLKAEQIKSSQRQDQVCRATY